MLKVNTESAEDDRCAVLVTDMCDVKVTESEGVHCMMIKGSVHQ